MMEQKNNPGIRIKNSGQPSSATPRKGISSSTLKLIAVIAMIIDHFGAGILGRYLSMNGLYSLDTGDVSAVSMWLEQNQTLYITYSATRMIGRIAFPIYCFTLVEGFERTRNQMKYAQRLLLFALISEIPFDLLFKGKVLEFIYQNVFFTLFCGLAVMMGLRWIEEHMNQKSITAALASVLTVIAGLAAAELLKTDYAAIGVACIVILYTFRKKKVWQIIAGCIIFCWEITAPLAFVPIGFYNGTRGLKLKYFFYLVYPVHIFLLYLICVALGINGYPAV